MNCQSDPDPCRLSEIEILGLLVFPYEKFPMRCTSRSSAAFDGFRTARNVSHVFYRVFLSSSGRSR